LTIMTLEDRIGQLIMARTYGHYISEESDEFERLVRLARQTKVGGFVVFQGDVYETAILLNKLQRHASLPLLVAADFERGVAMRIRRATYFPEAMAIAATRNTDYAYTVGKAIAEEGRALGIHQNFAPVADVNNNPTNPVINTRSFGEDPRLVAEMVAAFIRGTNDGGMIATAKHFPGHGDTGTDSHLDLPVLPFDRQRLDSVELVSFRRAIANDVGSVMVAHLELPIIDSVSGMPATLSHRAVSGLLKQELGFGGLIVTDAMEMRGILKGFSIGDAAVRALGAGVDIVVMPADEQTAVDAIVAAVHAGKLSEDRINASARKVLEIKSRLGLTRHRFADIDRIGSMVASDAHAALAKDIARKSITLVRNVGGIIPLRPAGKQKIGILVIGDSEDGRTDVHRPGSQLTNEPYGAFFLSQFRKRAGAVQNLRISPAFHTSHIDSVIRELKQFDLLLVALYAKVRSASGKAELPENLALAAKKLTDTDNRMVVVSFGNPYILSAFPNAEGALCAYSDAEVMVEASVEALFGEIGMSGKLPVTIPGYAVFGDGVALAQSVIRQDSPMSVGFDSRGLLALDTIMAAAIRDSAFPGGQLAIVREGVLVYNKSFGMLLYDNKISITNNTLYDLASLTKVVATTVAVMRLFDQGRLGIDDPVARFIPPFASGKKSSITVRHLLTHTSGLPAFRPLHKANTSPAEVIDSLYSTRLVADPGDSVIYSDLGMMILGKVVEVVSGEPLDRFVRREFYEPLGMSNTLFNPKEIPAMRIAPTELDTYWRGKLVWGTAHDENAAALGGVSGHAGLFSTASDLAVFMQMLLNGGTYGGIRYFQTPTVAQFTQRQEGAGTRALGWDTKSALGSSVGELFSERSFGHTGFTGTSIWVDPDRALFVILLTNRVHPSRLNTKIHRIRPLIHDAVIQALVSPASSKALTGTGRG
jgi:beta-glucosidase-like glycosyl hydrolase/CubicO group peptidase (beta-lactamase class C family)